jgi:hypothetical protein
MAWSVLSAAHKVRFSIVRPHWRPFDVNIIQVILAQTKRDQRIQDLVGMMDDIYAFITAADSLKKIESHKVILARMAQQTVECGYFITSYAQDRNFGMLQIIITCTITHTLSLPQGSDW